MNRAVFLDRDGVLVVPDIRDGRSYAPRTIDAFRLYPGTWLDLGRLKMAGFRLAVVTNQPDVGHDLVSCETLAEMHRTLAAALPLDLIKACIHRRNAGCDCRKPKPGMILRVAEKLGINLAASFMVGDRWQDIAAGQAAGCGATVLIDRGLGEGVGVDPTVTVTSLPQAVDFILGMAP